MGTDVRSLLLCARPSFLEGASRLLDFGHTMSEYNRALSPEQADFLALLGDWRSIGHDWATVLTVMERELEGRHADQL